MNLESFTQSPLVVELGWTLLHSLWQIAVIAIILFVALRLMRDLTPNARYLVSVAALLASLLLPVVTFVQMSSDSTARGDYALGGSKRIGRGESDVLASGEAGSVATVATGTPERGAAQSFVSSVGDRLEQLMPDLAPIGVCLWLLGVAFFTLRLGGGFAQLRKYRTTNATRLDDDWRVRLVDIYAAVGVTDAARVLKSAIVETPIAVGVLRPVVLVPAALFLQIHPRELETIIAHELIHIRRYDPLVNIAQCVIESVLFYHPAAWWISSQIRREREFAADAAVLNIFEDSHVTYARALANLEEIRLTANQKMPRYATAANGGNFMQRIQRILKIKTEASSANSAWTAGLAFLLTSAFLLAVFSFSSSDLVNAQSRGGGSRKLAIGFVSIPPLDRTANPPKDSDATARLLIQELKAHKVPAIGFLSGGMVSDGEKLFPVRANIARLWKDAGLEVGLGGFKHVSLYDTPADEYISNIETNERVAKKLFGDSIQLRYFSYPYLNAGKTVEDKTRVESWLGSHGYSSVKYTFDNNEWMYSYAYDMARNDNDVNTMKEIREAYLSYMSKMFDHYEAYATDLFSRDIPQTMVLTSSRLVTDTADDFFTMAEKRGYVFVPIEEAQSDPAYKTKEDFTGQAGISWFERWTLARGNKLRPEPEVDAEIQKMWNAKKPVVAKKAS